MSRKVLFSDIFVRLDKGVKLNAFQQSLLFYRPLAKFQKRKQMRFFSFIRFPGGLPLILGMALWDANGANDASKR